MSVNMKNSHHILTADQSRLSRTDMETKMEVFSPRRQESGGSFTGDRRKLPSVPLTSPPAADVKKDGEKASSL